ncbi:hypothetical protein AVEN_191885-1 [Araneus ventricosus]|uniref:Uncharacterized protein n=1 Tax=Araneus ventricosus TaxID=182803 RepID=A0A4Y2K9V3_ARAVE|nr:hypothetical protein AVEN_191885-1 [Araneus ventricosus]
MEEHRTRNGTFDPLDHLEQFLCAENDILFSLELPLRFESSEKIVFSSVPSHSQHSRTKKQKGGKGRNVTIARTQIAKKTCLKGFGNLVFGKGKVLSQRFPRQGLNLSTR